MADDSYSLDDALTGGVIGPPADSGDGGIAVFVSSLINSVTAMVNGDSVLINPGDTGVLMSIVDVQVFMNSLSNPSFPLHPVAVTDPIRIPSLYLYPSLQ